MNEDGIDIGFAGADHLSMIGIVSTSRNTAVWLLSCAVMVAPLEAGVVMNLRTTDYSSPAPAVEETRMVVDSGVLRMDITSPRRRAGEETSPRNHTLVFRDGESSSITVIDHRQKSFSVIDQESMAAFGTEMRMMMQATSMRVAALPPEQRAIVQKMLESQYGPDRGEGRPAAGTVIRTSERQTASGLPCVKYEVFQGGKKLREVWVAPPAAVRGGEPALTLLREMSDFYSTLMGSLEKVAPGLGSFRSDRSPFEDLARMNGFPVLTRNFAGGRVDTEIALLSVEEQRLSAAEFELPAGYSPAAKGASGPTKR